MKLTGRFKGHKGQSGGSSNKGQEVRKLSSEEHQGRCGSPSEQPLAPPPLPEDPNGYGPKSQMKMLRRLFWEVEQQQVVLAQIVEGQNSAQVGLDGVKDVLTEIGMRLAEILARLPAVPPVPNPEQQEVDALAGKIDGVAEALEQAVEDVAAEPPIEPIPGS